MSTTVNSPVCACGDPADVGRSAVRLLVGMLWVAQTVGVYAHAAVQADTTAAGSDAKQVAASVRDERSSTATPWDRDPPRIHRAWAPPGTYADEQSAKSTKLEISEVERDGVIRGHPHLFPADASATAGLARTGSPTAHARDASTNDGPALDESPPIAGAAKTANVPARAAGEWRYFPTDRGRQEQRRGSHVSTVAGGSPTTGYARGGAPTTEVADASQHGVARQEESPPVARPTATANVRGRVAGEWRYFPNDPIDPEQFTGSQVSLVVEPEYHRSWARGRQRFTFVPFARLDSQDSERTHFDVRELLWLSVYKDWELRLGIGKVFWGVTESQHLVDIINQTDLVENIDGEDKLGQPMLNVSLLRNWGTLDLFVLPYFRERTFPGREGRLRTIPRVDTDGAIFESSKEEKHIDFAVRWSQVIGDWDLGLSHFHGTSRDPRFLPGVREDGELVLFPVYEQIDQTGLDVQATKGSWLWKLEAIRRSGQGETFFAGTGGFEYTFYGVFDTVADVGWVMEYLYDERPKSIRSPFNNDIFAGFRLALNDVQSTEALIGCIVDLDSTARLCSVEASRRISNHWLIDLEIRTFQEFPDDDPLFSFSRDDYLQLGLGYYF